MSKLIRTISQNRKLTSILLISTIIVTGIIIVLSLIPYQNIDDNNNSNYTYTPEHPILPKFNITNNPINVTKDSIYNDMPSLLFTKDGYLYIALILFH